MSISEVVTRESVCKAIAIHDDMGREAFLAHYGYGPATRYFLSVDGKEYDSKAICGVAYLLNHPEGSRPRNFSGGVSNKNTAATVLANLGFRIVNSP